MYRTILILLFLNSCQESGFDSSEQSSATESIIDSPRGNGTQRPSQEADAIAESNDDRSTKPLDENVNIPTMISGAYLMQCVDRTPTNTASNVVMCRLLDPNASKTNLELVWTVLGSDGQELNAEEFSISPLGDKNDWHIAITSTVPITVSVKVMSLESQAIEILIAPNTSVYGRETSPEIEQPVEAPKGPVSPFTISESFSNASISESYWLAFDQNTQISMIDDRLNCDVSGPEKIYSGIITQETYDFTKGSALIEIVSTTKSEQASQPVVWGLKFNEDLRAHFLIEDNMLVARYFGETLTNVFSRTYVSSKDRFLKISHSEKTNELIYEVSNNSIKWKVFATVPAQWAVTSVQFEFHCGAWDAYSKPFGSKVDNIKIVLPQTLPEL